MPQTAQTGRIPGQKPFVVMTKPAGPACNYACDYCYYSDKKGLFEKGNAFRMAPELLETFIHDYIAASPGPVVTFAWQGGEPTLLGLEYYKKAFQLQQKHCPPGWTISNALQTHGGNLDANWARFLKANDVLVGLSIDGPKALHDTGRKDRKGRSTFQKTRSAIKLLQAHGVAFNTLTVVHARNKDQGAVIYRFLRRIGIRHMQFIPLVERHTKTGEDAGPPPAPYDKMSPWSLPRDGYGQFLCDVFDQWVKDDKRKISVQSFDVLLHAYLGLPSPLCVFAPSCGQALVLEHDGSLYACDHYVYPDHKLGNIKQTPIAELAGLEVQTEFGMAKNDVSDACKACPEYRLCYGGCPKHRFSQDQATGAPQNYLCPSYKKLNAHTRKDLLQLANEFRMEQSGRRP